MKNGFLNWLRTMFAEQPNTRELIVSLDAGDVVYHSRVNANGVREKWEEVRHNYQRAEPGEEFAA